MLKTKHIIFFSMILFYFLSTTVLWAEQVLIDNFDYSGQINTLTFQMVPRKVIVTNGSTTEMLLRLGLEKHLIGTAFLDNPVMPDLRESYERIPILSARYPGKEVALAQEPDFIIGWRSVFAPQTLGDVHYWNKLGVNTFISRNTILKPQRVSHFYDDMRDLGKIFRIEDKTEQYIDKTKNIIGKIDSRLPPMEERPRVLLAEFAQHGRFNAYGNDSLAGDMLHLAGGRNAFPNDGIYSMEDLIQADPDVIILTYMLQDMESVNVNLEKIRLHPILRKLKAVKNMRLYSIPLAEVYSADVRIPDGLERLARYLYPGEFDDEKI